jgi:hypothetical protein
MGAILCEEHIDERMVELTATLGHAGAPDLAKQRLCARCGAARGRGHKWCEGCRTDGRREYNQDYHRRHYRRKSRTGELRPSRRGEAALEA